MLTVGLLGTGFGLEVLAPAFHSNSVFEINAVYSREATRAKEAKRKLGVRKYFSEWKELIDSSGSDLVCIATPNHTHFDIAKYALEQGKHIIMAAPFAMHADEAEKLSALANEKNLVGVVAHHYNFFPARRFVTRLIKEGKIGMVKTVGRRYSSFNRYDQPAVPRWRFSKQMGGGVLNALGSHDVDYLLRTIGGIHKVNAELQTHITHRRDDTEAAITCTADDGYQVEMHFHNGVKATMSVNAAQPGKSLNDFVFYGTEGALMLNNDSEVLYYDKQGNRERLAIPPNYQITNLPGHRESSPFYMLAETVASAIYNDTSVSPTFEEAVHTQRVIDAAHASNGKERWIEIGSGKSQPKQVHPTSSQTIDKIYE
jgi:predicted dehydrogenase